MHSHFLNSKAEARPSPHNEPMSSLTHLIAVGLSIAGLVLLVVYGALNGRASHVVGFSIYGASLILLYLSSTLYHYFSIHGRAKRVFKRIDHAMIHVLIAGTYTPIALTFPRPGWGWSLFGVIWGLALIGFLIKIWGLAVKEWISVLLYLVMGWIIVIVFSPVLTSLPRDGMIWLVGGGFLYTLGTVFYALEKVVPRTKWFGMHEVFHLLVMAGSFSHFWFMFRYLVYFS